MGPVCLDKSTFGLEDPKHSKNYKSLFLRNLSKGQIWYKQRKQENYIGPVIQACTKYIKIYTCIVYNFQQSLIFNDFNDYKIINSVRREMNNND